MRSVEFTMIVEVEDRDPEVLHNDGYIHQGKPFRSRVYRALPDADDVVQQEDGSWVHVDVTRWRWLRGGDLINADGQPRKDHAQGFVWMETEVPGYAQRALLKEIERRARWARDEIAVWVQAAKDQVTHVEAAS